MKTTRKLLTKKRLLIGVIACLSQPGWADNSQLGLNDKSYFATTGVNYLVFSNWYNGLFSDSKMSGVEVIHHGVRTATNGDVRLNSTPEQWDPIPQFIERKVNEKDGTVEAFLHYPEYNFNYSIKARSTAKGLQITVNLPDKLPAALVGKAGFNMEFLPSVYQQKSFITDQQSGVLAIYPGGPKEQPQVAPALLASGHQLTLAAEDPALRVSIQSNQLLEMYDGRSKAQNGWFVVRSLLPAEQSGDILQWTLSANSQSDWLRQPVIGHSQVGYHPQQQKVAVIELDANDSKRATARLIKLGPQGQHQQVLSATPKDWGQYQRYHYAKFDFSSVTQAGVYVLQYGDVTTAAFRIDEDVYQQAWHPTLDVFFPVQMDHVLVNEAYRV